MNERLTFILVVLSAQLSLTFIIFYVLYGALGQLSSEHTALTTEVNDVCAISTPMMEEILQ